MHKHFQAMYKWFNFNRLQETVCTDTIFVNVPNIGCGSVCAQVFYGVRSKVINIYGMITKRGAHDSDNCFNQACYESNKLLSGKRGNIPTLQSSYDCKEEAS